MTCHLCNVEQRGKKRDPFNPFQFNIHCPALTSPLSTITHQTHDKQEKSPSPFPVPFPPSDIPPQVFPRRTLQEAPNPTNKKKEQQEKVTKVPNKVISKRSSPVHSGPDYSAHTQTTPWKNDISMPQVSRPTRSVVDAGRGYIRKSGTQETRDARKKTNGDVVYEKHREDSPA